MGCYRMNLKLTKSKIVLLFYLEVQTSITAVKQKKGASQPFDLNNVGSFSIFPGSRWKPFTKYILTPKYAIPPKTPHPIIVAWVTDIMLNHVPLKSAPTQSNTFQCEVF